mgnify:CR=1 FL=1
MTIPKLHQTFLSSTGVSTDTRAIKKGNIYFALKGDNFDGNKFTEQALAAGAVWAVIDDPEYAGAKTILVSDVLETLQELSKYHRKQLTIPVIGLTGSNGKTTTKELIAAALGTQFKVAFTKGNLNNHIGVPLTLLSITNEHEIAIVEMGANHQKEIEFLCSLSQPDYGYITNFGKAHLEGFGGIEGVIKGKSELYDFLRQHSKKAFVNADDSKQVEKTNGLDTITFGTSTKARYKTELAAGTAEAIAVRFEGETIQTHLTGNYNFSNVGAAIAMAKYFKVSTANIKTGLENYFPQNNRSQVQRTEKNVLVVDTYNANPSSMEQALLNFHDFPGKGKWVVLGDMFEMGDYEAEEHQRIAELAAVQNFEKTVFVGKAFCNSSINGDAVEKFKTTDELLFYLKNQSPKDKTILLKGSRGMRIERAIEFL